MDEVQRERLARNEAAFRKVNEGIESGHRLAEREKVAFLCECGALGCNSLIELTLAEYEAVRDNPRRFFVLPGHEEPQIEFVVEQAEGHLIIQKREREAQVAEREDPRS